MTKPTTKKITLITGVLVMSALLTGCGEGKDFGDIVFRDPQTVQSNAGGCPQERCPVPQTTPPPSTD